MYTFVAHFKVITSIAAVVTVYRGHLQAVLCVRDINTKVCRQVTLTQLIQHSVQVCSLNVK